MIPPTPVLKAPENFIKVKSYCTKGTEENFASSSGSGGGVGDLGGEGGGSSYGCQPF